MCFDCYVVSRLCTDKILCQNLYLCRQNKPYLLWLLKAIHCKLYIPWCLKETITRKSTFLWIYTTARIDHFLQFLAVSTSSKCRKIGHKTNMVQILNSLNTPYHTVLERGFWIIATNLKYDTNRLKNESLCSLEQRWSALCHTYINCFSSWRYMGILTLEGLI